MLLKRILLLLLIFGVNISFSQSGGTIIGKINATEIKTDQPSKLILREIYSDDIIQEANVESNGSFRFNSVPFSTYFVELYQNNKLITVNKVNVLSKVPEVVTINQIKTYNTDEVNVTGSYIATRSSGGRNIFSSSAITKMPEISSAKKIESVLLNSPGVVPDEDGRMHVRGEDSQLQYIIDGIPVYNKQSRIYSTLFNAENIRSYDFIRGGFDAEYGVALSGIVNINTKTGFEKPFFAHAFGQTGSFETNGGGIEIGGNIKEKVALYAAYSKTASDNYLDPIAWGDPIHNHGESDNLFVKGDILIADNIHLNFLGSFGKTNYEIPNGFKESEQDQMQEVTNKMFGIRLNAGITDNSVLSITGYARQDNAVITSNGIKQIQSSTDSLTALNNEKFFLGGEREIKTFGGMADFSASLISKDHFKTGIGMEVTPLEEYLSFAITNPNLSNPEISGGDSRYLPYDITQGGLPFESNESLDTKRYFAYVQDIIPYNNWNFSVGLRYDHFDIFESEDHISLRAGANYAINENLVLRGSYNRLLMQAPIENILVSSSAEAAQLTGADQEGIDNRVKTEKAHMLEIGGRYKLNKYFTFDLSGYGKLINDFIVKVELGNSGVIFPANLKEGFVVGGELQILMNKWNGLYGFLNISSCGSFGIIPEDGSTPVSAGLILGEEGENYSNPFSGEDIFPTEHNQIITAAFNLSYDLLSGLAVTLGGRFDSGLPFDLTGKNGEGLTEEESRAELKERGYSNKVIDLLWLGMEEPGSPDKRVAPHATFDLSCSYDLRKISKIPVKLTANVSNIFDTDYLYKFESTFSGTHFGTPRMFSLRADVYTY